MPTRDNRVTAYLSDEEVAQIDEWADEAGKSRSQLVRDAVLEYIDHDRSDRIESVVRENQAMLEDLQASLSAEAHTHTHTQSGGADDGGAPSQTAASSTVERARRIATRLHQNHDPPVRQLDVERAIEDIAGADDRTLSKYENLLKKRGLLWKHPTNQVWTDDRSQWVRWAEGVAVGKDVHEFLDEYPLDSVEYGELAAEVTQ